MTIAEAKDLYIKYDCSLFAMAREEKVQYEKYKALNISCEEEKKWKQEQLLFLYEQIKSTGNSKLFIKMNNYVEKSKSKKNIRIMENSLKYIKYDSIPLLKLFLGEKIYQLEVDWCLRRMI